MEKIINFIKSVRAEWFKIVWPTRENVIRTTGLLLLFSGLSALFFMIIDSILAKIFGWIFQF